MISSIDLTVISVVSCQASNLVPTSLLCSDDRFVLLPSHVWFLQSEIEIVPTDGFQV